MTVDTVVFASDNEMKSVLEESIGPPGCIPIRLEAEAADIAQLSSLMRNGARLGNEQFDDDTHLDEVVPKPWGYEYRAYVDEFFDFWALHIASPHSTSVHVHPRKLTYLICLGGQGVTVGLKTETPIQAGTILRIAPGVFHGTKSTGDKPLELIEIEVPRNKFDLMRLKDQYRRSGKGYESTTVESPESRMRKIPWLPNARMRQCAPDGRFRFELRTGMDIFYRRPAADIFYIPLCLSGAVRAEVEILTAQKNDTRRPNVDKHYLCVSKSN